jgi:hypothetical protein
MNQMPILVGVKHIKEKNTGPKTGWSTVLEYHFNHQHDSLQERSNAHNRESIGWDALAGASCRRKVEG